MSPPNLPDPVVVSRADLDYLLGHFYDEVLGTPDRSHWRLPLLREAADRMAAAATKQQAAKEGLPTHVRFAHPDAGYEGARAKALDALTPGQVYTLRSLHVGQSSSYVELYDVAGRFGSEFFEPHDPGFADEDKS
jgi:hypothetical protein